MAQLPCIGLSWPLTKPPFGGCAIYFHYSETDNTTIFPVCFKTTIVVVSNTNHPTLNHICNTSPLQPLHLSFSKCCTKITSHRIHGTGIFTYMNGEKWPHEMMGNVCKYSLHGSSWDANYGREVSSFFSCHHANSMIPLPRMASCHRVCLVV